VLEQIDKDVRRLSPEFSFYQQPTGRPRRECDRLIFSPLSYQSYSLYFFSSDFRAFAYTRATRGGRNSDRGVVARRAYRHDHVRELSSAAHAPQQSSSPLFSLHSNTESISYHLHVSIDAPAPPHRSPRPPPSFQQDTSVTGR
jgi:hypothetical protein